MSSLTILSEFLDFALYTHKVLSRNQMLSPMRECLHKLRPWGILQESGDGGDTSSLFSSLTQLNFLYGLTTSFCHTKYSLLIGEVLVVWLWAKAFHVSILAFNWRKFRRRELKPVKITSQTHEYLIFEDYIKYRPFFKKKNIWGICLSSCTTILSNYVAKSFPRINLYSTCQCKWALPAKVPTVCQIASDITSKV